MSSHVIIWDFETVPDLPGFAAANGLVGKKDTEILEALGGMFPKHIYHSIVCNGALVAHSEEGAGSSAYKGCGRGRVRDD
jgi:3'-5' exonuclease